MPHSNPRSPNGQAFSDEAKATLRSRVRSQIDRLPPEVRLAEREFLNSLLCRGLSEARWESVLAFWADDREPDLTPFLEAAAAGGARLAFPRLAAEGTLDFRVVPSATGPWENHFWGIRQPVGEAPVWKPGTGAVLLLVPGVAFDPAGGRLGRGKGFFDRFLSQRPPHLTVWGVAWSVQVVSHVPQAPHDQRLDGLLLGGNSAILSRGVHLWH